MRSRTPSLEKPASRRAWLFAHVNGMGTAAIGAVTAFVVINASRWTPGAPTLLVWVLPGVVGGVMLTLVQRKLRAQEKAASGGLASNDCPTLP